MPAARREAAELRRRLEARRPVKEREVTIPGAGKPYRVLMPANADAVLDELTDSFADAQTVTPGPAASEPHMPYWATPWASGLSLAEFVLSRRSDVAGRRALELGCGLGITAVAALEAGATVAVADCFAETLGYCRYNTVVNVGSGPRTLLADWRTETGRMLLIAAGPFDLVLAADVLYEAEDIDPLLALVPRLLASGGQFWLAEPGRATSTRFVAAAQTAGWQEAETIVLERDWPVGAGCARVVAHLYTAAG